jgi:hypothetical protein
VSQPFTCPGCGAAFVGAAAHHGKLFVCPRCDLVFQVGAAPRPPATATALQSNPSPVHRPAPAPAPAEFRPRRVKRRYVPGGQARRAAGANVRSGGPSFGRNLAATLTLLPLALLFLLAGGGALVLALVSIVDPNPPKPEPQTIRCQDLIDQGAGDNPHVLLTDFQLGMDHVLVTTDRAHSHRETYWIGVFPAGGGAGRERLRLLLKTDLPASRTSMQQLAQETQLQGIVRRQPSETEADAIRRLLLTDYPGTDLNHCLVLDHHATGTRLNDRGTMAALSAGIGGVLVLLSIPTGVLWWVLDRRSAKRLLARQAAPPGRPASGGPGLRS